MSDWWNWVRLLVLMPTIAYQTYKVFRDLPDKHSGRFYVPIMAIYTLLALGKLVWEDWTT